MSAFGAAPGVRRGCGTRKAGGIYAELGLSPNGVPLRHFLLDPPLPVDDLGFDFAKVGVTLFRRNNEAHILDWIGETHYPNVADFIEEVARFGLSRRLPAKFDFSLLTPSTRILCIHRKAWISNHGEYLAADPILCPTKRQDHEPNTPEGKPCLGTCWADLVTADDDPTRGHKRLVWREMPSFSYRGMRCPDGVTPVYRPAIFASFPISRLSVIHDAEGGTHKAALKAAVEARLPVVEVDE